MPLLSAFNTQCTKTPHHIAFIEGDHQLSYLQLHQQLQHLAGLLHSSSAQRVVIALDRGINAAIAILATLTAGACYIPVDIKNPNSRLRFICQDAGIQHIIGQGNCPDWVEQPHQWLDIEKLPESKNTLITQIYNTETLAAILYTSGSTGKPKGVALSHRAMKNFADWAANTFKLSQQDRVASLTPFYFDLSIFDLFSSLSRGATVNFIPSPLTLSPSRLTLWLQEHKISIWYTVPSILNFIALKGNLNNTPLPHLTRLLFAGEVFPTPQLISLCNLLPDVQFYNLYGPTETNVCCYWPVDRHQLNKQQAIPIGKAACGAKLILNPDTSELWVQSENNLSGYWQQGQLLPASSTDHFYATGDKISLNDDNEYCYHGRLDRMMKCSGYRVEPAEIEAVILQSPEVESCAILALKDLICGQRPVAFMVLNPDYQLADILHVIKQKLPSYMQPCQYIKLSSLPYLSNGKIDYPSLQQRLEAL